MVKVKICGITQLSDALLTSQLGAWALGFNFYRGSPRYIAPLTAKKIIATLPKNILKIGIFIDEPVQKIKEIMQVVGLDLAQVYTQMEGLDKTSTIMVIRPHSTQDIPDLEILHEYAYVLIDAPAQNQAYGGTGHLANWLLASALSQKVRLILAGGLKPNNVQSAIQQVEPFAVDVCSGIEKKEGIKSSEFLKQFIRECHA